MGQVEVYAWLKNQYEMGKHEWFSTQEVIKGLREGGATSGMLKGVRADLIRLCVSGYVEMQDLDKTGFNNYNRVFRFKAQDGQ